MNRLSSLFSRSGFSGETTGGGFRVGKYPHSSTAPGSRCATFPNLESVNKKYHMNADTKVEASAEPSTCPRVPVPDFHNHRVYETTINMGLNVNGVLSINFC